MLLHPPSGSQCSCAVRVSFPCVLVPRWVTILLLASFLMWSSSLMSRLCSLVVCLKLTVLSVVPTLVLRALTSSVSLLRGSPSVSLPVMECVAVLSWVCVLSLMFDRSLNVLRSFALRWLCAPLFMALLVLVTKSETLVTDPSIAPGMTLRLVPHCLRSL